MAAAPPPSRTRKYRSSVVRCGCDANTMPVVNAQIRRFGFRAAFAVLAAFNAALLVGQAHWVLDGLPLNDWSGFQQIDPAEPLALEWVKWSPLAASAFVTVIVPLGFGIWAALHIAALALFRRPDVALLVSASFPFWSDLLNGNILIFALVAAWRAIDGSRTATIAYCVIAAAVPRPIMLPVLAWLLIRRPVARWAFGAALAVVLVAAAATGDLEIWLQRLLAASAPEMGDATHNFAPSLFFGSAWLAIAWPLAVFALWRGWLGLASLLASPYWLPYYLLMTLLDVRGLTNMPTADEGDRTGLRPGIGIGAEGQELDPA